MILVLNCYDPENPKAGGAELYCSEIFSRIAKNLNQEVVWFAEKFNDRRNSSEDQPLQNEHNGIQIIRKGNRLTVLIHAFFFYLKNRKQITAVIDCFHGYPYLTPFYVAKSKRFTLIHEVAGREIWNTIFSFPVNVIGRFIESVLLKVIYRSEKFVTVSESTKEELMGLGIRDIHVIKNGLKKYSISDFFNGKNNHQLIYFGGLRVAMGGKKSIKNIADLIYCVDILKKDFPDVKLMIAGSTKGAYAKHLMTLATELKLRDNVIFLGYVPEERMGDLIAESYLAVNASLKEGWGNMVTEAAYLGTPAVTYNVNGHRDILKFDNGVMTKRNVPKEMAKEIKELFNDYEMYKKLQLNARQFAETLDWDKSYEEMRKVVGSK